MKWIFCVLIITSISVGCERMKGCDNVATITRISTPCPQWGIKKGNDVYPADTLPGEYKYEGMEACVQYELYMGDAACPCCGGTRARIISIGPLPD